MKLFIARHGETTWNIEKLMQGHTPGELTDKGKQQAALLAERVYELKPTVVYASDLTRAVDTAKAVQAKSRLPITFVPELRERNFGDLEGNPIARLKDNGFWELHPDESRFNAESETAFTKRIAKFVSELAEKHPTDKVLLISHVGVMNRLHYLSDPKNFTFVEYPNAEPVEFDMSKILKNSRALV